MAWLHIFYRNHADRGVTNCQTPDARVDSDGLEHLGAHLLPSPVLLALAPHDDRGYKKHTCY